MGMRENRDGIELNTPVFDQARAEAAVRELLLAVGENPNATDCETPRRGWRGLSGDVRGLYTDPDAVLDTVFEEGHDEMVLVKQIPMYSTCEHHLVSFHGVAHVGYIPGVDGRVTGLSKLARVVDLYAKRPQVQERLTAQIADAVMRKLKPGASSWSSRLNTCAWPCVVCASPGPSPLPRQFAASSNPVAHRDPRRWNSSCASDRPRVRVMG